MPLLSALGSAMQYFFSVGSKPQFDFQLQTVLGIVRANFASCNSEKSVALGRP